MSSSKSAIILRTLSHLSQRVRSLQHFFTEGETLLEVYSRAVETNDLETVVKCFEKKVDPNTPIHEESTALQIAIERDFFDLFALLMAHKFIDVNRSSKHDSSPLHHACYLQKMKFVTLLIKNRADINIQNKFGKTPLHYTVMEDSSEIASYLLRNKADPNIHDIFGNTPLATAVCDTKSFTMTDLLLQFGADIDTASLTDQHIFQQCCLGCKSKKDLRFVKLFINLGVDVNVRETISRKTPLHYAAISDYAPLAHILLHSGADPTLTDSQNLTPLQIAFQFANIEVAFIINMFLQGETEAIEYLELDWDVNV